MRILVYGAGVQGCELAHRLIQNQKNDVTLLARGEWKERIEQKGLVIFHWAQRRTTTDCVRTVDYLAPEDSYDLIFVTVQAGQLPQVLPVLAANRSEYVVFVGNNPDAQGTFLALKRPADRVAFGFQDTAGYRELDRVVSVHTSIGMTLGGATAPLSGVFRQRIKAAFGDVTYRLKFYGDMDEWLKCHIALILPICYVCYACGGELSKASREQRSAVLDAAWEGCEILKAAGVPVNDAENTDYYKPGSKRREMEVMLLATFKTPLGKLCAADHAMKATGEMRLLDEAFAALRSRTTLEMRAWDALRAAVPADILPQ